MSTHGWGVQAVPISQSNPISFLLFQELRVAMTCVLFDLDYSSARSLDLARDCFLSPSMIHQNINKHKFRLELMCKLVHLPRLYPQRLRGA